MKKKKNKEILPCAIFVVVPRASKIPLRLYFCLFLKVKELFALIRKAVLFVKA